MMYPPCPPWAGVIQTMGVTTMHFHPGWLGPTQDCGHGGYYAGDDRYGYVGHQQDSRTPRQENRIVHNVKSDHLIFQEATVVPGRQ
jgi:hypothetical protein